MKYLFYGQSENNSGPSNVNKDITTHLTDSFLYANSRNKYIQGLELLVKLLPCKTVVVSGVSRKGVLLVKAARLLRKKTVYIMHGCAQHELKLNGLTLACKGVEQEKYLMEQVDLLLPVSEKYMDWVKKEFPQYANKTYYLNNGIELSVPEEYLYAEKKAGSVAVAGGMRAEKNNKVVIDAVGIMQIPATLDIYGNVRKRQITSSNGNVITFVGKHPHDDFLRNLSEVQVFVLNSCFEPFSLAIGEALLCGCSVLVSECAGITGLLDLEECDLIHDPMDTEEIRSKIEYLLENPNNERILSKLNLDEYSYAKSVERLEKICTQLAKGGQDQWRS